MTLINTDGLVLIGPGSEWFWTAVSWIVLAGTALAIYRQVVDARGAAALARQEALWNRWQSRPLLLGRILTLTSLRDGIPIEPGDQHAADILFFMENLEGLREAGGLSDKEVYANWAWVIRPWWRLLEPLVRAERDYMQVALVWSGFEELAAMCRRVDEKAGIAPAALMGPFDYAGPISRARSRLQLLYDADSNFMPPA